MTAITRCGVIGRRKDDIASRPGTAGANKRLNMMIKSWMARGANLWRREEQVLYQVTGQQSYTYGTDHITTTADAVETTLGAAEGASQTSLTVASSTGMAASDVAGVKLDDGTIHFSTISSVTDSTTIVIASGLASAAASGNNVYTYTNKAGSPVNLFYAFRRDNSNVDVPIRLFSREEYSNQSLKTTSGPITEIHHDQQLTSKLFVWPTGDRSQDKAILIADRVVEDFDSAANTPDFPVEWQNALMWGLSDQLSGVYGRPIEERNYYKKRAKEEFDEADGFDIEEGTVQFQLERR